MKELQLEDISTLYKKIVAYQTVKKLYIFYKSNNVNNKSI